MPTLLDVGERALVANVVSKYCAHGGDDCALIPLGDKSLVITTDPVPMPAAHLLGGSTDEYWRGWLLVTINASDLAAAGATPLAFVSAIEAVPSMPVADFERMLAGIRDACDEEGLSYVGGNIKESDSLRATGTALGVAPSPRPLRRVGLHEGDVLVSLGQGGVFWRDALTLKLGGGLVNEAVSPVFRPVSQLRIVHHMAAREFLTAAMDNSDGLLPTLSQLAAANTVRLELDLDRLAVPALHNHPTAQSVGPERLWFGWGDWNVIVGVRPESIADARALVSQLGGDMVEIGRVTNSSSAEVVLVRGDAAIRAPRLESERFARDSWFSEGIDGYVARLTALPIG